MWKNWEDNAKAASSLHWPILLLFNALFVHWNVNQTILYAIYISPVADLMKLSNFADDIVFLPKDVFLRKESE